MSTGTPIRCDQTGEIFSSAYQAAKVMGLAKQNLLGHLKGDSRRSHVGGYTFTKKNGGVFPPFRRKPMKKTGRGIKRRVRCDQTGQVFSSISHAARVLNLHDSNIRRHINKDPKCPRVGGYTFTLLSGS